MGMTLAESLGDANKLYEFLRVSKLNNREKPFYVLGKYFSLNVVIETLEHELLEYTKTRYSDYVEGHRDQKIELISRMKKLQTYYLREVELLVVTLLEKQLPEIQEHTISVNQI